MSVATDDGYMPTFNRRSLALVTVPGQPARPRYVAMEEMFGAERLIHGVIFVASAGYDHIWPRYCDSIANELRRNSTFTLAELRKRNQRYERENFSDLCNHIRKKFELTQGAPELFPKWLLVLVNKADLYWNEVGSVENTYLPGCESEFDQLIDRLRTQIGIDTIDYLVRPVATESSPYLFRSSYGDISAQPILDQTQGSVSVSSIIELLSEIC